MEESETADRLESHSGNIFTGRQVRLRALEPEDWPVFYEWNFDSEATRRGYWIPFPQSKEAARAWAARQALEAGTDDRFFFVVENLAGEIVGSLSTNECNRRNGTFSYGVMTRPEHQRRGYASEAIRLLAGYFFRELRYQKVTARVYGFNEPSLRLHRSLGFIEEGRLRRMIYTDGQYHDELIFGLTAEEYAARGAAST